MFCVHGSIAREQFSTQWSVTEKQAKHARQIAHAALSHTQNKRNEKNMLSRADFLRGSPDWTNNGPIN
jgi:DNA polymerase II small subunit/DNA polymerase delta subunit B